MATPVAAPPPPAALAVGVFPAFAVARPVTLVCKERVLSLSGDDFSIKDVDGNVVCKVEGKTISLHDTKTFEDPQGRELFKLKKKMLSLRSSHEAVSPDGKVIFEVQGSFKILTSKMTAKFTNASDGKEHEIVCKGNWRDSKCQMVLQEDGRVLATIKRETFSIRHLGADKQTYWVEVEPGVDLVLMAALAVTFDERNNDAN